MTVTIETVMSYYAVCGECTWFGEVHEDDKDAAQRDALEHGRHGPCTREAWQTALDLAMEPPC